MGVAKIARKAGGAVRELARGTPEVEERAGAGTLRLCPGPESKNPQSPLGAGGFLRGSLTLTYFLTGIRNIIGAASFHGPVRDGKGWFQSAMGVRLKLEGMDWLRIALLALCIAP